MISFLARYGILMPEFLLTFYNTYTSLTKFIVIVGLLFLAFFGFKTFRATLVLGGAVLGGTLAGLYLTPYVKPYIAAYIPAEIHTGTLVALVAAILSALICYKLYKLLVFAVGGVAGYFIVGPMAAKWLSASVPAIAETAVTPIGIIIISALSALICALIIYIFFKPVFIIFTSLVGLALDGACIVYAVVYTAPSETMVYAGLAIGAAVGLIATVYQFKTNSNVKRLRL